METSLLTTKACPVPSDGGSDGESGHYGHFKALALGEVGVRHPVAVVWRHH